MKNEKKVIACVDQSRYAEYVTDYAGWAAMRMQAPMELLHIIDLHPETATSVDHSGAIGIDTQDQLLVEMSEQDASKNKIAREQGRIFLNRLRERALAYGVVAPDVRQRLGNLEDTLAEQERDVRLFVLGRRGQSADLTQRDLGRNVERIVRSLNKPILTVSAEFTTPSRVMIAFNGSAPTRRCVEMVAASPLFKGLHIHLLMSGEASPDARKQLQWAKHILETSGFEVADTLVPGEAQAAISQAIQNEGIDLLIMGAYSHSPFRSLFTGSRTAELLKSSTIPTLLVR
ncbi:universal stress protein [Zwartia sp.]|uniref:universal stress protein n=1 Tax=Zwartia sp. TaxID=2978004 RepID=UPI002728D162|nr:universal stress protein [Zwartia sp.]MDO9023992.1 universal stress protein [Zwartia sp.]